jgi:hypothetical protein
MTRNVKNSLKKKKKKKTKEKSCMQQLNQYVSVGNDLTTSLV